MKHNTQVIFQKTRSTRRLYRSEEIKSVDGRVTGKRGVSDGVEEFYYETSIDLDALHELARKAAANASLTAKDGPLRVKILARRRMEVA
jgi:hypothetical protein